MRNFRSTQLIQVILLAASQLPQPTWGQAAPARDYDEEMRRAEKEGDKVLDWIRKHAPATPKAAAPVVAKPAPVSPAKPVPKPVPEPAAKPSPVTKPTAASAPVPAQASSNPSVAASQSAKAHVPQPAPIDPLRLFDFEQDTEGFQVNDTKQWGIVDAALVATTEGGAHGARALRVYSPRDSWVGHEFETPQDWTKYQSLTFALRSAQGFSGKIAVKSGNDWDWCEARAQRIGEKGDFGVYRIQLVSKVCPTIRRDVVHGVHLWLGADDTFILDDFRFEPAP